MIALKKPRLIGWIMGAGVLFVVIGAVSPQQIPVVIYKLSLISLAAVLGYWLDRSLFPFARPGHDIKHEQDDMSCVFAAVMLRRALIVAAVCLSVAIGL